MGRDFSHSSTRGNCIENSSIFNVFFDTLNGYISRSKANLAERKMEPLFLQTREGGNSWGDQFVSTDITPGLYMDFINVDMGYFIIGCSARGIFKSETQGKTWSAIYEENDPNIKEQFR